MRCCWSFYAHPLALKRANWDLGCSSKSLTCQKIRNPPAALPNHGIALAKGQTIYSPPGHPKSRNKRCSYRIYAAAIFSSDAGPRFAPMKALFSTAEAECGRSIVLIGSSACCSAMKRWPHGGNFRAAFLSGRIPSPGPVRAGSHRRSVLQREILQAHDLVLPSIQATRIAAQYVARLSN